MKTTKDNLLEVCEYFLQEIGEPMHYKELAKFLVDAQAFDFSKVKEPDQIIWSRLMNDIKRRGEDSAFRFFKGGIFCAATIRGSSEAAVPAAEIKATATVRNPEREKLRKRVDESAGEHKQRVESYSETETCGNCKFLDFEQMYALTQRRGICHNYANSKMVGRVINDRACPFWERRPDAQRRRDARLREEVVKAMAKANADTGKNQRK